MDIGKGRADQQLGRRAPWRRPRAPRAASDVGLGQGAVHLPIAGDQRAHSGRHGVLHSMPSPYPPRPGLATRPLLRYGRPPNPRTDTDAHRTSPPRRDLGRQGPLRPADPLLRRLGHRRHGEESLRPRHLPRPRRRPAGDAGGRPGRHAAGDAAARPPARQPVRERPAHPPRHRRAGGGPAGARPRAAGRGRAAEGRRAGQRGARLRLRHPGLPRPRRPVLPGGVPELPAQQRPAASRASST